MYSTSNIVYVLNDNAKECAAITTSLTRRGYNVVCFGHGTDLLSIARKLIPACVLLDLVIPHLSGLDVLKQLDPLTYPAPILMVAGDGCLIANAVEAMKSGAYDFIEKPITGSQLAERIESARLRFAYKNAAVQISTGAANTEGAANQKRLTSREQEVLSEWVAGATSKEIARTYGLSHRTVEIHRSRIMKKLKGKNSAEIVKIAIANSESLGIMTAKHRGRPG